MAAGSVVINFDVLKLEFPEHTMLRDFCRLNAVTVACPMNSVLYLVVTVTLFLATLKALSAK